jgi:hypothetical protein
MRDEYDFSNGVRGKYAGRYRADAQVEILEGEDPSDVDGTRSNQPGGEQYVGASRARCMVCLEPDVMRVFPDSGSVNEALRLLIKAAKDAQELQRAN